MFSQTRAHGGNCKNERRYRNEEVDEKSEYGKMCKRGSKREEWIWKDVQITDTKKKNQDGLTEARAYSPPKVATHRSSGWITFTTIKQTIFCMIKLVFNYKN